MSRVKNEYRIASPFPLTKSTIRATKKGEWRISKIKLTKDEVFMSNFRAIRDGHPESAVDPGSYTNLHKNGVCIMSDTQLEVHTNMPLFKKAFELGGHILINGLGMGWVIENLLRVKKVKSITVIEIDRTLIDIVQKHLKTLKSKIPVTIVHADALKYIPLKDKKWDIVWHDIWSDINYEGNIEQMKELTRTYRRLCTWQGCWSRELSLRIQRRYG